MCTRGRCRRAPIAAHCESDLPGGCAGGTTFGSRMTLQNRVDPWGELHAHPSKAGTRMGNRGILHDASKRIVRRSDRNAWVCCVPKFKGVDRKPLFQPNRYSELFFLDEATAFAAGHRPCAYCQRARFDEFKAAWIQARHPSSNGTVLVRDIDAPLHAARYARGGVKVTYTAGAADLPEGTLFEVLGVAYLKRRDGYRAWSFEGYGEPTTLPESSAVTVLTPRPFVDTFAAGLRPLVHASAEE